MPAAVVEAVRAADVDEPPAGMERPSAGTGSGDGVRALAPPGGGLVGRAVDG